MTRVGDLSHQVLAGSAAVVALVGALDANAVTAWAGAVVGVIALGWGMLRDQVRKSHDERRRREWEDRMATHRIRKIEETGVDPFPGGLPPLEHEDAK